LRALRVMTYPGKQPVEISRKLKDDPGCLPLSIAMTALWNVRTH
jgi:hypothetical protein